MTEQASWDAYCGRKAEQERLSHAEARLAWLAEECRRLVRGWREEYAESGHDYELSVLAQCADELQDVMMWDRKP